MKSYIGSIFLFCFATAAHAMEVKPEMTIFEAARTNNCQFIKEQLEKTGKNYSWFTRNGAIDQYLCQKDNQGKTALHYATEQGHLEALSLLGYKKAMFTGDSQGRVPLHYAAAHGQSTLVEHIFRLQIGLEEKDMFFIDHNRQFPLHLAVLNGDYKTNQAFVNHYCSNYNCELGASVFLPIFAPFICISHTNVVNKKDNFGKTPLHMAIEKKDPKLVDILLQAVGMFTSFPSDNAGKTVVHTAALAGNFDSFQSLLNKGFSVHDVDLEQRTTLHDAAQGGNAQIANKLLELKVNHTKVDKNGNIAVHIAAYHGNTEALTELLKHGCAIDAKNNDGLTPLYIATMQNRVPAMKVLLGKKADPNCTDKNGSTALHYATENDQTEVMELLLTKGAQINKVDNEYKDDPRGGGKTALHKAVIRGNCNAAGILLNHGADINQLDKGETPLDASIIMNGKMTEGGKTALYYAIQNNNLAMIFLLLKYYADVDKTGNYCKTPLQLAAETKNIYAIEHLLENNVQIDRGIRYDETYQKFLDETIENIKSMNNKWVPLLTNVITPAAIKNTPVLVYKLGCLARKKPDATTTETYKLSEEDKTKDKNHAQEPDFWEKKFRDFSESDKVDQVYDKFKGNITSFWQWVFGCNDEKLVEANAKLVEITRHLQKTALHFAVTSGNSAIVKALLRAKANVETKSFDGKIPLHSAAECGFVDIVSDLLSNDSPTDSQDDNGMTPLHYAARKGHIEVAKKLLEFNANPLVQNIDGRTPLHEACENNRSAFALWFMTLPCINTKVVLHKDKHGRIPLHYAAANGDEALIAKLLFYSPRESLKFVDNREETPERVAINAKQSAKIILLLKDKFPYVNHKEVPCNNAQ